MDGKVYYTPTTFPRSSLTFSNLIDYIDMSTSNSGLLNTINHFRERFEAVPQQAATLGNGTTEDPLPSMSKLALIIDVTEFICGAGISDSDPRGLRELLRQFNYEVHPESESVMEKPTKTKAEILELFSSFHAKCRERNPSSVLIYIGSNGDFPSCIISSDLRRIHLFQDIVRKFSRTNCPNLIGRPKIFITSLTRACNFVVFDKEEEFLWSIEDEADKLADLPGSVSRINIHGGPWLVGFLNFKICKDSEYSFQNVLGKVQECIVKIGDKDLKIPSSFPDWNKKTFFFPFPSNEQVEVQTSSRISIDKASLLGEGAFGKVYKGTFENRDVAVKVLNRKDLEMARSEIAALCDLKKHPNVVFYYAIEMVKDSYYIALELCSSNLANWWNVPANKSKISCLKILNEICKGVSYIHEQKIIHQDLKPDNILVQESNGDIKILISDFGFGRKLPEGKHSIFNSNAPLRSYAWMAPECSLQENLTNAVDIFSLGCLFYFLLTNSHPFGDLQDAIWIPGNIRLGNYNKPLIVPDDTSGMAKLIENMIHQEFHLRPSIASVLKHPVFWENEKKMKFFNEIKDTMCCPRNRNFVWEIEAGRGEVFPGGWIEYLEGPLQWEVRRVRMGVKYNVNIMKDLVRLIRNWYQHYNELDDHVKSVFGNKEDYVMYWLKKFPNLLPYTWEKFKYFRNNRSFNHSYFY